MIVYYKLATKDIVRTEDNTQVPVMPFNMTLEEKKAYYKTINEGFIVLEKEIGVDILSYILNFDTNDNYTGITLKGVI